MDNVDCTVMTSMIRFQRRPLLVKLEIYMLEYDTIGRLGCWLIRAYPLSLSLFSILSLSLFLLLYINIRITLSYDIHSMVYLLQKIGIDL